MPDLSLWQIVLLQFLVFGGALAVTSVGFGFAMLLTPLLLLILEPRLVVELNLVLGTLMVGVVAMSVWRHIYWRAVAPQFLGSLAGIPLGALALARLDDATLRLTIAALVLVLSVPAFLGQFRPIQREQPAALGVGLVAGALWAGVALGGTVLALFAVNQGWPKDMVRGTLAAFFVVTGPVILGAHALTGVLTWGVLGFTALFVPVALLGGWAAIRLAPHLREGAFRRAIIALILTTSLFVAVREAIALV